MAMGPLPNSSSTHVRKPASSQYFLTKIAFPRYLKFHGSVQVGVSLMPEAIRKDIAPFGSTTDELLSSLAWAASAGATNPGIRLFVMHQYLEQYAPLLKLCRQYLGQRGWQLTVDVPRFAPDTLSQIAIRYPELAPTLAQELDPNSGRSLREIAGQARRKIKQLRPPPEKEAHVYQELRRILDEIGCQEVPITACKGDPQALLSLVHDGVICKSPCACYGPSRMMCEFLTLARRRPPCQSCPYYAVGLRAAPIRAIAHTQNPMWSARENGPARRGPRQAPFRVQGPAHRMALARSSPPWRTDHPRRRSQYEQEQPDARSCRQGLHRQRNARQNEGQDRRCGAAPSRRQHSEDASVAGEGGGRQTSARLP